MEIRVRVRDKEFNIIVEKSSDRYAVTIGDRTYLVHPVGLTEDRIDLILDGKRYTIYRAWTRDYHYLALNGQQYRIEEVEGFKGEVGFKDNILVAPMTGSIVKVNNNEGELIEAGSTIMIVEAMKMENELKAPYRARVKKIYGKVGDQVEGGKSLVELEPVE
ncbi:MAG TPA: hypothetical protein EYP24_04775 [bacterium (Candidatus Stahlbacteria)]|nr:hypothetical protein [Candidatus Stahlbacteria bacterium]